MVIGIDLGGTNIRAGLIEKGILVRKETVSCPSKATYEEVLAQLEGLIDMVMCPEVKGIGVGVPSVVDSEEGIVYNVMNIPSWTKVPLKQLLQERFSVPAFINNDSNCFALGVTLFGEGQKYRNLVGLTIGTGLGSGIIINGELYSGHNTGAGEIGSLPYLTADFEHYCSSGFFVKYYNITGEEAAKRATAGDAKTLELWNEFGSHIGELMKAVLFAYDPEAIVIGGGIASAFTFYKDAMYKAIQTFPYGETVKRIKIFVNEVDDVALLGASALVGNHEK